MHQACRSRVHYRLDILDRCIKFEWRAVEVVEGDGARSTPSSKVLAFKQTMIPISASLAEFRVAVWSSLVEIAETLYTSRPNCISATEHQGEQMSNEQQGGGS